jgi:hypothetical protein
MTKEIISSGGSPYQIYKSPNSHIKMPSQPKPPKYKIGQRVQERNKSQSFSKIPKNRKYTIVGGPFLGKPDNSKYKRRRWNYDCLEEGKNKSEVKVQGMLQPLEE